MKTIPTYDLLEPLGYIDLKAVRSWCEKNGVFIMKQGKREFVNETNFYLAYWKLFIAHIKSEHGANWEEVYSLYKDGNIPELITLFEAVSSGLPVFKDGRKKNGFYDQLLKEFNDEKKAA